MPARLAKDSVEGSYDHFNIDQFTHKWSGPPLLGARIRQLSVIHLMISTTKVTLMITKLLLYLLLDFIIHWYIYQLSFPKFGIVFSLLCKINREVLVKPKV